MATRSTWSHFIDKPNREDYENERNIDGTEHERHPMTNRLEIWSWYLADGATTPIGMILGSMIIPLYASTLSTQYGCIHHTPYQCDYYNEPIHSDQHVMVPFAASYWKPESFATLMVAISGGLQCLAYFFIASVADYSTYQHYLYRISIVCTWCMVLACAIFNKNDYYIALGIWTAILLVPFGLSNIFYNSYLPVLVENHWVIRRLLRKNENTSDRSTTTSQYEHETRCIQDNLSQFGLAIGYLGGLIVTVFAAVLLFALSDMTKELMDKPHGITTDVVFNDHSAVHIVHETQELWAKPVIAMNVWYSNSMNISYINAIQFMYSINNDMNINGSVHGIHNNNNNGNINLAHFQLNKSDDYINQIELFMDTNVQYNMIHAMRFTTRYDDMFVVGNINPNNNYNIEIITSSQHPSYALSGYSTVNAIYNNSIHNDSMNIISGFNAFVFQDYSAGPYGQNTDIQSVFIFCGIWTLLLTLPSFCMLKKRKKQNIAATKSIFTVSAVDYCISIKSSTKYPHLFRTLIAWFVSSDAENTIGTVGILFAQKELHMTSVQLILLLIEIQFLAMAGGVLFTFLSNKFHINAKKLLIFHLCVNALLPIWTIIGLNPSIGIGLVNIWEIYVVVGLLYALQLGSMFSSGRSLYGHLIPKGDESRYFGLYELTNKGSSWIGPLISALIANVANLRWAMIYVFVFYLIAIPILQWCVDYDVGMQQAGKQLDQDINSISADQDAVEMDQVDHYRMETANSDSDSEKP